ncbi:putative glycosyltransferase EpsD [Moorella thermoacetica]|uniref:Putative glycosyltransferase EpsD n=1 Tax=Neomoorella thermoacetica TaxID=1525 RepID=A0A1J5NRA9_NEOTH|nr:putative glycosyltransferase EpsD [Moorella thermoacetica]
MFVATVYTHLAAFHLPFMQLLQGKGYEVHAAASPDQGRKEEVEAIGVRCWEIPFSRSPYSLKNWRALRELGRLLEAYRFDLIHVHTPVASFLGRYLARVTGQGPVLYTAHGFHFYHGAPLRNWLLYYPAERLAARWTNGLIVMNREDYDSAVKMGFRPGENLFYVHGVGVDLKKFAGGTGSINIQEKLGLGKNDIVVTCVAEFSPVKNHAFLLEAWSKFIARKINTSLWLAGDGYLRPYFERMVHKKRIGRVHFLKFCRDIPQVLQETDIFVLVSRREGLPRSLMEAMAAGKPVVASDVRGNRDLVDHGRTGFLVGLGDVEGLAGYLELLARDKNLRLALGRAAREKIGDYSLDKVLAEMAAVYRRYLPS